MMMKMDEITKIADQILIQLIQDNTLCKYIDHTLSIPKPYIGSGEIRLVILGQDPTVKDPESRKSIKTVLNLDKNGSVRAYLTRVCNGLGLDIRENIYATNLYKNFFIKPPTQINDIDIFHVFLDAWLPLLLDELRIFGEIPILTLGEPILAPLFISDIPSKVRYYWGYTPKWQSGVFEPFRYINRNDNKLSRIMFPFPHQPSKDRPFYKTRMDDYILFTKKTMISTR
jgi:hypothetical protein